jgi:hypothetical protein
VWFRRARLLIVSPDSSGTACPLSGRNSTYRPVQISGASSVTQFSEPRPHCLHAGCGSSSGAERQVADTRYFGRLLLRAHRQWPSRGSRRAAEKRDE